MLVKTYNGANVTSPFPNYIFNVLSQSKYNWIFRYIKFKYNKLNKGTFYMNPTHF